MRKNLQTLLQIVLNMNMMQFHLPEWFFNCFFQFIAQFQKQARMASMYLMNDFFQK